MNPVCAGPAPARASPEPLSLGRAQRARGLGFTNRPRVRDDVRPTDAAATEEWVADQPIDLETILGERFTVLSGYRAPGSRSTFDHVVVGPAGVFVVLRFDEVGRVRVSGERVTLNDESIVPIVQRARRQALAVQLLLADGLAELDLRVTPVVWVRRASLGLRRLASGVRLASARDLRRRVARAPSVLPATEARKLTLLAEGRLVPAQGLSA